MSSNHNIPAGAWRPAAATLHVGAHQVRGVTPVKHAPEVARRKAASRGGLWLVEFVDGTATVEYGSKIGVRNA